MCGIIGYVGLNNCIDVLLEGLERLEYRGYDSAGIAVHNGKDVNVKKAVGKLLNLNEIVKKETILGTLGIGHTRWATHGEPCYVNSHPITNSDNSISIVHNGIIENHNSLKNELIEKGYEFKSETDTEVIVHLIDYFYKSTSNLEEAIWLCVEKLKGSYSLGIIAKDFPETLFAIKKDSPLVVGLGKEENYIASDISAILKYTRKVYLLDDNELVILNNKEIKIIDENKNKIEKELVNIDWDIELAEKEGYDHFMLKEIFEQPKVIRNTIASRLTNNGVKLDNISLTKEEIKKIDRVYIVGCGTAYNSGIIGKFLIESKIRIPVSCEIASEFRYNNPIVDSNTLVIVISQSGETADSLAALKLAKEKGARILSFVNCVGSSIARASDDVFYTLAGPEIAVASTKAFTSQVIAMYLLVLHIGLEVNKISIEEYREIKTYIEELPVLVESILNRSEEIKLFAKKYLMSKNIFLIGRGLDYLISLEGCLKIKEVSYKHSEAFPAGELKHGSIALIEEDTLIIGIATEERLFEKTVSNIKECKARGGKVLGIAMEDNTEISSFCDDIIYIPKTHDMLTSVLVNVPQQLLAYYFAILLGNDADKPRNLAKSVTVE